MPTTTHVLINVSYFCIFLQDFSWTSTLHFQVHKKINKQLIYVNKKVNKQLFVYFWFPLIFAFILKILCVLWLWISLKFLHFQLFVYILNQLFVYIWISCLFTLDFCWYFVYISPVFSIYYWYSGQREITKVPLNSSILSCLFTF